MSLDGFIVYDIKITFRGVNISFRGCVLVIGRRSEPTRSQKSRTPHIHLYTNELAESVNHSPSLSASSRPDLIVEAKRSMASCPVESKVGRMKGFFGYFLAFKPNSTNMP